MNDSTRTQRTEVLTAGPAEGIAGLLGVDLPDLTGGGLPPLWHWVYLLDRPAQCDLGPDGHPVRGVVPVPPGPGLRRMWAGGRVSSLRPLLVGAEATRTSRVLRSEAKVGRSGAMTFVTVRHEVAQDGRVVVEEDQDIVYREPTQGPAGPAPAAPTPEAPAPTPEAPAPTPEAPAPAPEAPAPTPEAPAPARPRHRPPNQGAPGRPATSGASR